jgi:hypothetical protein
MIHAISRGFWVDNEPRVRNPVGLSASRIAVDTHVVTLSRNLIDNVVRCVERAGLSVAELVAQPLATADAVLTEEEEELGVLLIDVGGGTTDLAVFLDGSIVFTGAVPVAGHYITHDVAVALGVTHPQAEQLKLTYGCANQWAAVEDELVPLEEGAEPTASRRFLQEVIRARAKEMFGLVAQAVEGSECRWPPPGGAVITGGGSLLPGIAGGGERMVRPAGSRVATGRSSCSKHHRWRPGGLVYYGQKEAETQRARSWKPVARCRCWGADVVAWIAICLRSPWEGARTMTDPQTPAASWCCAGRHRSMSIQRWRWRRDPPAGSEGAPSIHRRRPDGREPFPPPACPSAPSPCTASWAAASPVWRAAAAPWPRWRWAFRWCRASVCCAASGRRR